MLHSHCRTWPPFSIATIERALRVKPAARTIDSGPRRKLTRDQSRVVQNPAVPGPAVTLRVKRVMHKVGLPEVRLLEDERQVGVARVPVLVGRVPSPAEARAENRKTEIPCP
jgi:hypothetical protein